MATIIIVGVLAALLCGLYRWLLPKPLSGIPYNKASAKNLFGDVPSLVEEVSKIGDLAGYIRKQSSKHNSPIAQVFMKPFGKPSLVVCDFREAQDVLLHRGKDFDRSTFMADVFSGAGKDHHVAKQTGPEWKAHRRLLQDLMSPSFLNSVAETAIYRSSLNILKLWELKTDLAGGRPFSASEDVFLAALDAVTAFAFGKEFKENATSSQTELIESLQRSHVAAGGQDDPVEFPTAKLGQVISSVLAITAAVERVRGAASIRLEWWFVSLEAGFRKAMKDKDDAIHEELEKSVQARKQNGQGDGDLWVRSAADHMVDREARLAEKEGRRLAPHSPAMVVETLGFIVAGHDTSSTTLCWGVKFLADHPTVQQRVRAELKQPSRQPRQMAGCRPSPRSPKRHYDTTLLGHFAPKGTHVFFLNSGPSFLEPAFEIDESLRSPQARDGKVSAWDAEDIEAFKPERWIASENGKEVFDSQAQAGPAMPFGLGLRGCYGRRSAYLELRLLLTVFLWKFEFLKCPAELSGYDAVDRVTHEPKKSYLRLNKVVV